MKSLDGKTQDTCRGVDEFVSGNIFIRPNALLAKGHVTHGHRHTFDHTSIVFTGSVHVKMLGDDGVVMEKEFKAPSYFLVKANVEHEITALEDDTTYWCVFSLRDSEGRVVQEFDGWHTY